MKLLISAAAMLGIMLLSSCSSMYRTSQTPDDVYFSPGQNRATVASNRDRDDDDEYAYVDPDDNYLRRKVANRNRWNTIDDADYWYSYNRPYSNLYGYNYFTSPFIGNGWSLGFGNFYGPNTFGGYPFWNTWGYNYPGFYNHPLYGGYNSFPGYYGHTGYGYYPGTAIIRGVRSNTGPKPYMGGYTNQSFNNNNRPINSRNNNSALGRFMRSTVGGNDNSSNSSRFPTYNNDNSRPSRSFTPSTQSSFPSSSGSSSSGSSGGARSGGATSSSAGSRGGRGN